MSRRSTRQRNTTLAIRETDPSAVPLLSMNTNTSPANSEAEEGVEIKKPNGRKRKATTERTTKQRRGGAKKRQKVYKEASLLGINDDLSRLVYSYLEPLDLLNLSRTSRDLHAFLTDAELSQSVWKAAFLNVTPVPPACPPDLKMPWYADLLFGKDCYLCHRSKLSVYTTWSARLRSCARCIERRFTSNNSVDLSLASDLSVLLRTWPKIVTKTYTKLYFDHKMVDQWKQDYAKSLDKPKWLLQKKNECIAIEKHSAACEDWVEAREEHLEELQAAIISQREAIVLNRVKLLGWEYELSKLRSPHKVEDLKVVIEACYQELTEDVFQMLDPILIKHMATAKQRRIREERAKLLKQRLPILHQVYHDYVSSLPSDALTSDIGEIFLHPDVNNLLSLTPSEEFTPTSHRDRLHAMFPIITEQWKLETDRKLVAIYNKGCSGAGAIADHTVLNLATTIFSCSSCPAFQYEGSESIPYPRVMMHSCATCNKSYSRQRLIDGDKAILQAVTARHLWNECGSIEVKARNVRTLMSAVTLCGLDPRKATVADMNTLDPIFECTSCNDPYKGRATMRWTILAGHNRDLHHHGNDPKNLMKFERLNEEEERLIRERMNDAEARKRGEKSYTGLECTHCKIPGCSFDLRQHVIQKHAIPNPTDKDIVPRLGAICIRTVYWFWPPRELEIPAGLVNDASNM